MRAALFLAFAAGLTGCANQTAQAYRNYADTLRVEGRMRTEVAPADAPFDAALLARNFELIAFNSEYTRNEAELVEETTPAPLRRWTGPIRVKMTGKTIRPEDKALMAALTKRLSGLSGLDISVVAGEDAEIHMLILNAAERREFIRQMRLRDLEVRAPLIVEWSKSLKYPCVGNLATSDKAQPGIITGAIIVVKAEIQGPLRRGCFEEELTQTMGLTNDDSSVRPSIFNDDQEFVYLTRHDEHLLKMLYDPRLNPGMTAAEARPLLPRIAADALNDS